MIFHFIRYTQAGWKFNIQPYASEYSSANYHPQYLPLPVGINIPIDEGYQTEAARNADIGYRAWNMGILTWSNKTIDEKILALPKPTVQDEYRFVFKYWGIVWATYALINQLVRFKNPFAQIGAFLKQRGTPRYKLYQQLYDWSAYQTFQSPLVQQQPLVSVIIPTLNRYEYLQDVMLDLEKQSYKNFDVIVVDQSEPFNADFYKQFKLNINAIPQNEKLLWTARNRAIKESKADLLLFFDDDSRVEPDWIEQNVKCIDFFKADISAGVSLAVAGAKIPQSYNFFRWADQFDSGNALVRRAVFHKIGMFDLQFNKQRMGDGEFGIRAYLNGCKSISNPYGKRIHLKVPSGGLREIGHWDGFRPKKWFAPKPIPSVIYLFKKYFPAHLYHSSIFMGILLSNVSYKNKRSNKMLAVSAILTFVKAPMLYIQYRRSLSKATKMLQEGDKIEWLSK